MVHICLGNIERPCLKRRKIGEGRAGKERRRGGRKERKKMIYLLKTYNPSLIVRKTSDKFQHQVRHYGACL